MTEHAIEPKATLLQRLGNLSILTTPEALVVAASLYFTVLCNSRFWSLLLTGEGAGFVGSAKILVSTVLLLTGAHIILLLPFSSRLTIKPFLVLLFAANAFTVYFMDQFGVYVDMSMIRNVFQTDAKETAELVTWGMVPYIVGFAIIPTTIVLRTKFTERTFKSAVKRKALLVAVAIAALLIAGMVSFKEYSSFFRNNKPARYLITPGNYMVAVTRVAFSSGRELSKERTPVGTDAVLGDRWATSERPVIFVLVVGETARASSFSLNGYDRDTNPQLRNVPGLINFTNVSSCGTSTADSLPCMFSRFGRSDPEQKHARQYESLLDVVSHSGLDVTWLDNNSGCKGVCSGVESIELEGTDDVNCNSGECFDQILVNALDSRLKGPARSSLLVLHQKGSHGPSYYRRYPAEFERFTPACSSDDFDNCTQDEILNAYDNSILYTDYILAELIAHLEAASAAYDTALLYVSDHGESLGEKGFYLHGLPYAIAPDHQTRVPMVAWISRQFANRFSIDSNAIERSATSKAFSHDNLFHSVLGALDIKTAVYDPKLDLFVSTRNSSGTEVESTE